MIVALTPGADTRDGVEPATVTPSKAIATRLARLVMEQTRPPAISGAATTTVETRARRCVESAAKLLLDSGNAAALAQLTDAAEVSAQEGLPLAAILNRVNEILRGCVHRLAANSEDYRSVLVGTRCIVDMLDSVSVALARATVREVKATAGESHTAVHRLTSALLAGHLHHPRVIEAGIGRHDSYVVLALAIPPHPDENDPALDAAVIARRTLRRVQSELAERPGPQALPLLSPVGGTLLLPGEPVDNTEIEDLVAALSRAARIPVTAVMVTTTAEHIPSSVDSAHTVLDMVRRLSRAPALYTFAEFALEYQLTRPGPGGRALETLLDPLDAHPELLDTLRQHIGNNLARKVTAREMSIHPNTVDYRLRRVEQLTGLDPAQLSGSWQVQSALIARSLRSGRNPAVRGVASPRSGRRRVGR
ncbi:PucR family transcriptional regulator [Nocardia sp. NBC_00416]|uniref:PucR family transcriptional regulator n=1 Tax=Nocardia sp. NBC_00416 TaxID=2975991 RepID=UPI002E20A76B